ncbi:VOC family protein [Amycolatopsis taiwanensis]|uniref:VOC domain-containing protein n=1 Tax=Amycolatopsis taiwanensis TaxID=342230 RepID=A0A9W6R0R0_9PSEU|nr:VOC family protein [Amycolatopsis taiwanensis]GLY65425.1 hypothetical protein Atai01_20440 [Amycolatopsis taiwanensis]
MTAEYPLTALHHVGIVVPDLQAAVADTRRRLGLDLRVFPAGVYRCRIHGRYAEPVTQVALSVEGPPHLELLAAVSGNDVWVPVPGVHHLGFVVDDLPAAARRLAQAGSPLVMGGLGEGRFPAGATYHRDPLGHLVELLDERTADRFARSLAEPGG